MATTLEQITADALALPPGEREQLASLLWESLPGDDAPLSEAWLIEIKRRIEEVDNGMETFDADEVLAEIRRELAAGRREAA